MARYEFQGYLGDFGQAPGSTIVPPNVGDGDYWQVVGKALVSGGWTKLSLREMSDPLVGFDSPTGRNATVYVAPGVAVPAQNAELRSGTSFSAKASATPVVTQPVPSTQTTTQAQPTSTQTTQVTQPQTATQPATSSSSDFSTTAAGVATILNPLAQVGAAFVQADQQRRTDKTLFKLQQQQMTPQMPLMMMQQSPGAGMSTTTATILGLSVMALVGLGIYVSLKQQK